MEMKTYLIVVEIHALRFNFQIDFNQKTISPYVRIKCLDKQFHTQQLSNISLINHKFEIITKLSIKDLREKCFELETVNSTPFYTSDVILARYSINLGGILHKIPLKIKYLWSKMENVNSDEDYFIKYSLQIVDNTTKILQIHPFAIINSLHRRRKKEKLIHSTKEIFSKFTHLNLNFYKAEFIFIHELRNYEIFFVINSRGVELFKSNNKFIGSDVDMKFHINIPLNDVDFESISSEVCCIEVWKKLLLGNKLLTKYSFMLSKLRESNSQWIFLYGPNINDNSINKLKSVPSDQKVENYIYYGKMLVSYRFENNEMVMIEELDPPFINMLKYSCWVDIYELSSNSNMSKENIFVQSQFLNNITNTNTAKYNNSTDKIYWDERISPFQITLPEDNFENLYTYLRIYRVTLLGENECIGYIKFKITDLIKYNSVVKYRWEKITPINNFFCPNSYLLCSINIYPLDRTFVPPYIETMNYNKYQIYCVLKSIRTDKDLQNSFIEMNYNGKTEKSNIIDKIIVKHEFKEIISIETIMREKFETFQQIQLSLFTIKNKYNSPKLVGKCEIPLENVDTFINKEETEDLFIDFSKNLKKYSLISNKHQEDIAQLKCIIYIVKI